ncbi:MAG: DJ-1/PfpI family protein [Alphaproteobacteria bacterium]|nr:DJ-1/PfpI family protein [Alphaproteobacteria bacterium]MCB9928569.1 DJ-1/PfpI family protein [Alphaproteobacteria bacterium]
MQQEKRLSGKKVAIMVANGFQETHMTEVQKVLTQQGAASSVISNEIGVVNGWHEESWGHNFFVDSSLNKVLPSQYDALLVPGGERSLQSLCGNAHAKRIVKGMIDSGKPVGLLGRGPLLLVAAECAAGRSVSGNAVIEETVSKAGAIWQAGGEPVVDGAVLSGAGREDLEAFIEIFVEAIAVGTLEQTSEAA